MHLRLFRRLFLVRAAQIIYHLWSRAGRLFRLVRRTTHSRRHLDHREGISLFRQHL